MQISLLGLNFSLTNTHIQHPFSTPANQTEPNYLLIVGYSCWKRLIIYQRIIQVDQDYWVAVLGQICLAFHRTRKFPEFLSYKVERNSRYMEIGMS
jgi:hypothetical protein